MEKDVLVTIAGTHYDAGGASDARETIETVNRGTYYKKAGKHYILFDEYEEGAAEPIRNMVKINGQDVFEIRKSGRRNSHLVFERGKIHMSEYETGFGKFLLGVHTRNLYVTEHEESILAEIFYSLEMNGEALSECEIKVLIKGIKDEI